jgi:hypothetical protein
MHSIRKNTKNKFYGFVFSALVVVLLLLAGPAQGFTLNLDLDNTAPQQGQAVTFTAVIYIEQEEQLPVNELTLELNGPELITCKFDAIGNPLSECKDIKVERISNTSYGYGFNFGYGPEGNYNWGYGYGYGYGTSKKLAYKITLDTTKHSYGLYTTKLKAKISDKEFSTAGHDLYINAYNASGTPETNQSSSAPDNSNTGGGNSCKTDWQCTAWSACIDGKQTRTCEKIRPQCYGGLPPERTRTCISPEWPQFLINQLNQPYITEDQPIGTDFENLGEEKTTDEQPASLITGAVTGTMNALSKARGIVTVTAIILLLVAFAVVVWVRKTRFRKVPKLPSYKDFY